MPSFSGLNGLRRTGIDHRRPILAAVLGLTAALAIAGSNDGYAQSRAETLRQVSGQTVNTLDPTALARSREAMGFSANVYDRLLTFDVKEGPNGLTYDFSKLRGEIAESFELSPDGKKITFKLKRDVKFHDGTPLTAADVKWSFDRGLSGKTLGKAQFAATAINNPEQVVVIDDYTVEVNLDKSDRLAAPNIAGMLAPIYNSKLAKEHATEADPWATEWLNNNDAGSGAYYVESFRSGEEVILRRNEEWKGGRNGELPFFKRILFHTVPDATTRASLIERGDADISIDLRPTDIETLANAADISVVSVPQSNAFTMVAFNTKMPPFDNKLVRQALAFALPFDALYEAALAKRGLPLFGATWEGRPTDPGFPQPLPFRQDLEKAKALLKEAGFADGFKTTFTYNISSAGVSEPMAALIKEAFEKVGVMVEIQKLPDSQMAEALTAKTIPFFTETSSANLPSTDYFFRIFLQGDTRWNYSSWSNPEIARLTESARYEVDDAKYDEAAIEMIRLFVDEAPMIMLWQANQDAVMRKDVKGFTYWYHRQLDYRDLRRDGQ